MTDNVGLSSSDANADFALRKGQAKTLPVALTLEHVSPMTRLLSKQTETKEVQRSLTLQKVEYQRKEELFKRREENLRKKDLELQAALVLFNKFLKENEHKRRRAEHRANEEVKKTIKWEEEIAARRHELGEKRLKFKELRRKFKRNVQYQNYLQQVFEDNGTHFNDPNDIMTRHFLLHQAFVGNEERQKVSTEENEKLRDGFTRYKKSQDRLHLGLGVSLIDTQGTLEEAVTNSDVAERKVGLDDEGKAEAERRITQITLAVDNLYNRAAYGLGHQYIQHTTTRQLGSKDGKDSLQIRKEEAFLKLEVIASYLTDFKKMWTQLANKPENSRPRAFIYGPRIPAGGLIGTTAGQQPGGAIGVTITGSTNNGSAASRPPATGSTLTVPGTANSTTGGSSGGDDSNDITSSPMVGRSIIGGHGGGSGNRYYTSNNTNEHSTTSSFVGAAGAGPNQSRTELGRRRVT